MTTRNKEERKTSTIRELGGEYWSEITRRIEDAQVDWRTKERLVDILMGVLARHVGEVVENDTDLPVEPLSDDSQVRNDPN